MKKVLLVLVVIVIIVGGMYLTLPLFVDNVVDEELPVAQVSLDEFDQSVSMPSEEAMESMTEEEKLAMEKELMEESQMMEVVVDEKMMEGSSEMEAKSDPNTLPNESFPLVLSSGTFRNADDFHQGSGDAKLIMLDDERTIARLENFSVTNGPDLFVYLVKNPNPTSSADVKDGFVNLGRLKGNKGNQNYEIPSEIDVDEYNSIVIYCRAFSVLFSPAPLS